MKSTDSVIVSWDFSHGKDVGVLIVGRQQKGREKPILTIQRKPIGHGIMLVVRNRYVMKYHF